MEFDIFSCVEFWTTYRWHGKLTVDSRLILGSCKVQIAYKAPLKIFSIAGFWNQEDNHNLFDTSVSGSNSSLANVTTFVFIKSILE